MSQHDVQIGYEALADYGILLSEATQVLTSIADLPAAERTEEFADLQAVYAEGADSHQGELLPPGYRPQDKELRDLPEILRSMFGTVMALGSTLTADTRVLPETAVAGYHVVESMTRALSAALDRLDDPAYVAEKAGTVMACAYALGSRPTAVAQAANPVVGLAAAAHCGEAALRDFALALQNP